MTSVDVEGSEQAGSGRSPIPARAWKALAVGAAGFSLMSFNTTATNLAFGDISDTFSSSRESTLGWVASIFFIGLASLLPVAGRLADRIGRRRVFRLGLATFALGSLLSAIAPNAVVLIAARFITAAGGAMILPSSLAVVLPEFPKDRHVTAVTMWTATGPLASALAPAVSALVLASANWRVLFAISVPISLVALAAGWGALAESKAERRVGRLDILGAVLGTGAIAALVFTVSQGSSLGWASLPVLGASVATVALFPLFVLRCQRHSDPLINLSVFLLPPVRVANIANFLLNIAGLAVWLVWPLYMSRVWGFSKVQTGLGLLPGPVVSGFATPLGGRLAERFGHLFVVRLGSFAPILAMAWPLLFLGKEPNYWLAVAPAIGLFGVGWSLTQPQLNSGVLARVSADFYGEVNASFNTVRNIAGALGVALAVSIIGDKGRSDVLAAYDRTFLLFLVSVVACWVVLFFIYPRVVRAADGPS